MKLIHSLFSFIESIRTAGHAANLGRNGKIKEAQNCYADAKGVCRGL